MRSPRREVRASARTRVPDMCTSQVSLKHAMGRIVSAEGGRTTGDCPEPIQEAVQESRLEGRSCTRDAPHRQHIRAVEEGHRSERAAERTRQLVHTRDDRLCRLEAPLETLVRHFDRRREAKRFVHQDDAHVRDREREQRGHLHQLRLFGVERVLQPARDRVTEMRDRVVERTERESASRSARIHTHWVSHRNIRQAPAQIGPRTHESRKSGSPGF